MLHTLAEVIETARGGPRLALFVAGGHDTAALRAIQVALSYGMVDATLVGNRAAIRNACAEVGLEDGQISILDEPDPTAVTRRAAEIVRQREGTCLMKGLVSTADFMRAVLNKQVGLSTGAVLSHVAVVESPALRRLILSTDGAVNIAPTLEQKVGLIHNLLPVAAALGIREPKIACLAAVEIVNPKMPATLDAAELARMGREGAFPGAVVEGPFGFDNAVSPRAAEHKGVRSLVAGQADALVAHDLESAVIVVKSAIYLGGAKTSGIVTGGLRPIVLTSRADTHEAKLASIALAVHLAKRYSQSHAEPEKEART